VAHGHLQRARATADEWSVPRAIGLCRPEIALSPPLPNPSRRRRVAVHAAVAVLFGFVVVAVAVAVSRREAADLRDANRAAAERAGRLSGIGAERALHAALRDGRLPLEDRRMFERGLAAAGEEGQQNLRIWDRAGEVVYDSARLAGRPVTREHRGDALQAVRRNETVSRPHTHDGERTLHVYVPIAGPGRAPGAAGVYELDLGYGPILRQADLAGARLRRDLLLAAVLVWLALLPLTIPLVRRFADRHQPGRRRLLRRFAQALKAHELELHYQPKISIATGELAGAEALVRWRRDGRLVAPGEFLPTVESSTMIAPLTHYVVESAIAQCASWRASGREVPVAINVSPSLLRDRGLPDRLEAALGRHALPARLLTVEVTETAVIDDEARAARVLEAIAALGVSVSVDDFGTGYSSLARLVGFPIDEVKIDRSFVTDARRQPRPVLSSTVQMARTLGLRVVAEGVEDESTLNALRGLGCHHAQGFLFAPALPAEELLEWQPPASAAAAEVQRILGALRNDLGMDAAFVAEFVDDEKVVRALAGHTELPTRAPLCDTYCERVVEGVFPNVIPDTRQWAATRQLAITERGNLGAYIGVPLVRTDGNVYGTLCCVSSTARADLGERELASVRRAAARLGPHLDGADLAIAVATA
jgi:EAL domain-containing protein (putative c-di-GMP-specific phosphodiesterase class I)